MLPRFNTDQFENILFVNKYCSFCILENFILVGPKMLLTLQKSLYFL